eukprot:1236724-Pleurochrysis_carterae.AAC.1
MARYRKSVRQSTLVRPIPADAQLATTGPAASTRIEQNCLSIARPRKPARTGDEQGPSHNVEEGPSHEDEQGPSHEMSRSQTRR